MVRFTDAYMRRFRLSELIEQSSSKSDLPFIVICVIVMEGHLGDIQTSLLLIIIMCDKLKPVLSIHSLNSFSLNGYISSLFQENALKDVMLSAECTQVIYQ